MHFHVAILYDMLCDAASQTQHTVFIILLYCVSTYCHLIFIGRYLNIYLMHHRRKIE